MSAFTSALSIGVHTWRFRGGLVFKAHRHGISLDSRLESNVEEGEKILYEKSVNLKLAGNEVYYTDDLYE